jgi:hypothetical protein
LVYYAGKEIRNEKSGVRTDQIYLMLNYCINLIIMVSFCDVKKIEKSVYNLLLVGYTLGEDLRFL